MAKWGLAINLKQHWTDEQGFTEQSLPPGWKLEKFQARKQVGDVQFVEPHHLPPPGETVRDDMRILVFDEAEGMDVDTARATFSGADEVPDPVPEDPGRTKILAKTKYAVDLSKMLPAKAAEMAGKGAQAANVVDMTAPELAALLTFKADTRGV